MNKFIAIEGVIGVGKTTLTRLLQPIFSADVLLEQFEENPFLPKFYAEPERYAFQTQIFFLLSRYHQLHDTAECTSLIADYTLAKDKIFAHLTLENDDLAMYDRVHAALDLSLRQPDLVVYLKADHGEIMNRIALRDRSYERDMDPNYIRDLTTLYDEWLAKAHPFPILTVDITDINYVARPEDLAIIVSQIREKLDVQ